MVQITTIENILDIQKLPLLLAYPTALLASNFVFNKNGYNVSNTPISQILLFTLILIPLFLASSVTLIYTLVTQNISKTSNASILAKNKVFLTLAGLFAAAWVLGSVRAVMLSLVLIINVNFPFLAISLIFDIFGLYIKDKLYFFPTGLEQSNLYFIILSYIILFLIKDALRNFEILQTNSLTIPLVTVCITSLILGYNFQMINWSMYFVTLGCTIVLNITRIELKGLSFQKGSVTIIGVISILLEILSLNSNYTENVLLTVGEFLLIASTAFINIDDSLFKKVNSEKLAKEEELTILQELLKHKDTRAIFQFLLLNASFMLVQFLYSFRSKSLGLLSDSLHMALDCTSLALGLVAGVLAKKPPSVSFPFGLSRIETLAGFANGVLLIGIVAGIFIEGIERIINPVALEKTSELLIVSFLGLVVNIVGIFAFNHGHEHGHGHSHSHIHSHGSSEDENQNMKGIFLHILADTLGSAGVVVSTLLTKIFHSNIFDPIASLFIATLIFFSAIPLIKTSASGLLLSLDDKKDELLRDILSQVATTPGVISYTTPRFWYSADMAVTNTSDEGQSHSIELKQHTHQHQVEHESEHSHTHSTKKDEHNHEHTHAQEHNHEHTQEHNHEHTTNEHKHKSNETHEHDHEHSHKETHQDEHTHSVDCSHTHTNSSEDHSECSEHKTSFQLVGYIHIQYMDGDNSTIIKKRVQKIFENNNIKVAIQVENESSSCWCRTTI